MNYLMIFITIILNASGAFFLKKGSVAIFSTDNTTVKNFIISFITNPELIGGIFFFGLSFVVGTFVYSKLPLNIAYPTIVGGSILIVLILSVVFNQEKITITTLLFMILILVGIWGLNN